MNDSDRRRSYSDKRRQRNADAGACLNETARGDHGPATHGVLCLGCRSHHRGHDLEREFGVDAYRVLLRQAHRENRSIHEVAAERRSA